MKSKKLSLVLVLSFMSLFAGCGGGGGGSDGGSSGTGTVSMSITDAKPMLPESSGNVITNVFVTIDEVLVHKSGGGWVPMPLPDKPDPFEIDLMFYSDGNYTQLVPPRAVEAGKYTQIRLSVVSAKLVFNDDPANWVDLDIPSENLKTDQNFEFIIPAGGVIDDTQIPKKAAVDITIDFDLSKSIVVEGNGSYKLKPVLHIVETEAAATIEGTVSNFSGDYAVITVRDLSVNNDPNDGQNGDIYTTLTVTNDDPNYSVFWLVPNHNYSVEIDNDPNDANNQKIVYNVGPGETVIVNF